MTSIFDTHDTTRRRLYMRSIRRGILEMDVILGRFARAKLNDLTVEQLNTYEAFLEENDHDLFAWVNGQGQAPQRWMPLIKDIQNTIEAPST